MSGVWVIIPVKRFARAKTRLAGVLGPRERCALARAMFEHVFDVVSDAPSIAGIVAATDCAEITERMEKRGAAAIFDDPDQPLGVVVDRAVGSLAVRGADAAIVLMADLPWLRTRDVERLARAVEDRSLVIAPDLRDEGTNALAVALPARMPTCFGHGDSFARHTRAAHERAIDTCVHRSVGVGFDVDEPRDLATFHR